jgi:ABC-type glycerol-3-phosphate transport system substrate-binding protein
VGEKHALSVAVSLLLLASTGCTSRKDEYRDGRLVIIYWEKWTGFEGQAMQDVVDAFNASQDRIWVEKVTTSRLDRKLLASIAGGTPPDVAGLWSYHIPAYASKNAILPLTERMRKAGLTEDYYKPVYWDLCQWQGVHYALPTTPATNALFWNKRLFREGGLDPDRAPKTIAELDEFAEKLTKYDEKGNMIQSGFLPSIPGSWMWGWGYWFGGRLLSDPETISVDSAKNIKAAEWVASYSKKYGVGAIERFRTSLYQGAERVFSSPLDPFLAGKVAMQVQGVWGYNFIEKFSPGMEWGAAPFPAVDPELKDVAMAECDILVLPRGSLHPDEAWEFMEFANSQEAMEMLCLGHRKFSPLAETSDAFWEKNPNPYIKVFSDLAASPNVFAFPKTTIRTEYLREIDAAMDIIQNLSRTPADALHGVKWRMQKRLDYEVRRLKKRGTWHPERAGMTSALKPIGKRPRSIESPSGAVIQEFGEGFLTG